jgi:hypothetical protein
VRFDCCTTFSFEFQSAELVAKSGPGLRRGDGFFGLGVRQSRWLWLEAGHGDVFLF